MNNLRLAVYLITVTWLSSCSSVGPVAKNWSDKLREYQINPLFPPREDVYVGDIYLVKVDKDSSKLEKNDFLSFGSLLSYLNLQQEITDFYKSRPSFPTTSLDEKGNFKLSKTEDEAGVYQSKDISSLKKVIFPNFLASSASEKGLSASIPAQALAATFGLNSKDIESASISIPQAESYAYPALPAYKQVVSYCTDDDDFKNLVKNNDFFLVTEVFYTRQMNISIDRKSSSGAKGDVEFAIDPSKLGNLIGELKTENGISTKDISKIKEGSNSEPESNAIISQTQLSEVLSALDKTKSNLENSTQKTSLPSIGVWSVQSSGLKVFLHGTFDKPIAIGYRGLKFNGDCTFNGVANTSDTLFSSNDVGKDKPSIEKEKAGVESKNK